MRNSGNSRAFTMVELMAAICIVFVLVFALVTYVPQVIDWARQTSDRQTLTVLNDALSRYKTEGGSVGGLNPMTPISQVLTSLQTAVTWGGYGHQFLHGGVTYTGRSLSATGTGAQYRFTRYNYYTAEPGISDLGPTGGSLVGWWKFDEGSGTTAADSSGRGNNGTLGTGLTWATGRMGGGYALIGSNPSGGLSLPSSASLTGISSQVSVCAWIRQATFLNWSDYVISNWTNDGGWVLGCDQTNRLYFGVMKGGTQKYYCYSAPTTTDAWHFLVGVYDGSQIILYVDGLKCSPTSLVGQGLHTLSPMIEIGQCSNNIDDVRIYSRALSAAEVAALYGQ